MIEAKSNRPQFIPLVNDDDEIIGSGEKLDVHEKGLLHRAFSILIYNKRGEMLIQQRALSKYHSPGLWTNTCCSHPHVGETMEQAISRRLVEEMGFVCELKYQFKFQYKASFSNGLTEHELDHVYKGFYDSEVTINLEEVDSYKWVSKSILLKDIAENPDNYTYWFKYLLKNYESEIEWT